MKVYRCPSPHNFVCLMSSTVIAKIPEEGGGPEEREGEIRWRNRVEGAEKKRGEREREGEVERGEIV